MGNCVGWTWSTATRSAFWHRSVLHNSSFHPLPRECTGTAVRNPRMHSTSLDFV